MFCFPLQTERGKRNDDDLLPYLTLVSTATVYSLLLGVCVVCESLFVVIPTALDLMKNDRGGIKAPGTVGDQTFHSSAVECGVNRSRSGAKAKAIKANV